jgi:YihY family inner membrane protein
MKVAGRAVVRFWRKAYEDNLTGMAGMVAYNMMLSVFPLALIALFVAGRVLSSPDFSASVLADLEQLFPSATQDTLSAALRGVQGTSTTVGIVALAASLWVGASFWGALDTAFCRIYHLPCRSWVRQKLFGFAMLIFVLVFMAATVAVPALQSLVASGTRDLPFGLSEVSGLVYWLTLLGGVISLFGLLCVIYETVPKGSIPFACVWPGALGATIAMVVVDYGFPLYLSNVSTIARLGTSVLFAVIALLWFYALAIILLSGAVVNELRFETRRASAAVAPPQPPRGNEREEREERGQGPAGERRGAEPTGERRG